MKATTRRRIRLRKEWRVAIALLVTVLTITGFSSSRSQRTVTAIRIGVISPFTGAGANYGKSARAGIDLAVDEINSTGGIRGKKLDPVYEDDKGSPADAVTAFQKLVSVDKVPAVLGPFYSGNVLACAPEAERGHVVMLTGSGTSDNIRNAGEYTFRVCPSNDAQAKTVAEFAIHKLKLRTAFIIYRNVDYGVTLRDAFQRAYTSMGGKIAGMESVRADATDVREQLAKLKAASPALIFAAVHYTEGAALLRQAKELGIKGVIIGTDGGYDPQLIQIAGDAANGSYWVTVGWGDESSNNVARFRKMYRQRYGDEPSVYSGLYYDATKVLARALAASSNFDGSSIRKALLEIHDYQGPTGTTNFDALGDVDKPFAVYRIQKGKFVPLQSSMGKSRKDHR